MHGRALLSAALLDWIRYGLDLRFLRGVEAFAAFLAERHPELHVRAPRAWTSEFGTAEEAVRVCWPGVPCRTWACGRYKAESPAA